MREIKFRYWNGITNQMVNNPEMPYKKDWTIEQLFSDRGWVWMQFTGLLDKNGKEIYEGDIVRVFGKSEQERVDEVIWEKYHSGFALNQAPSGSLFGGEQIEVIGNIYETPLKGLNL